QLEGCLLARLANLSLAAAVPAPCSSHTTMACFPNPTEGGDVPMRIVLMGFCLGIGATLAWQSYGDDARRTIARSYPQLGWLAPSPQPATATARKPAPSSR